jgi:hypothetical protein
MSKSPRHASTYRAARRNGSGAAVKHSPVLPSQIKLRPVPARPLLSPQERKAVRNSIRRHRAKLRAMFGTALPAAGRLVSKASEPFKGRLSIGAHSSLRKLMRAARRGALQVAMPSAAEIAKHDWASRPRAAQR